MRLSRSKILRWRWVVYVLLVLWFLPAAWKRWQSGGQSGDSSDSAGIQMQDSDMPEPSGFHVLPDGTKVPIYELSPEQARTKFGITDLDNNAEAGNQIETGSNAGMNLTTTSSSGSDSIPAVPEGIPSKSELDSKKHSILDDGEK